MLTKMIGEVGGQCSPAIWATVVNEVIIHTAVLVGIPGGCRSGGGSEDAILPQIRITRASGGCRGGGSEDAIPPQIGLHETKRLVDLNTKYKCRAPTRR